MSQQATAITPHDESLRLNQTLAHYASHALQAHGCLIDSVQTSELGVRIRLHRQPVEALKIRGFDVRRHEGGQLRCFVRGTYNGCRVEWPAP